MSWISHVSWISHGWGETKLAKTVCSGSLAPRFVNNDCVAAEIIHSMAHVHHEVPIWSGIQCYMQIGAPPKKQQHYCCIMAMSIGSAMKGENRACLLLTAVVPTRRE